MIVASVAIIGAAALFALFGALQPVRGCDQNCDGCASACRREQQDYL